MLNPGNFARSIQLFKLSLRVMGKNKKLLFFPLANLFLFAALIAAVFFASAILRSTSYLGSRADGHTGLQSFGVGYARLIALYLGSMFGITFFNVALYHEILKALVGGKVSLRQGFAFACRRSQAILTWSLFGGSVGVLIWLLSDTLGFVAKLSLRLMGFTWSVAATFVIPVIIRDESSNPILLLRSSAVMIRRTWGEMLVGYAGIRLLPALLVLLLGIALVAHGSSGDFTLHIVGGWELLVFIAFAILMIVFAILITTADNIFCCALYVYASEGVMPEPYSPEMMDAAWKVKKGP